MLLNQSGLARNTKSNTEPGMVDDRGWLEDVAPETKNDYSLIEHPFAHC